MKQQNNIKNRLHVLLFEQQTSLGKKFNITLILFILMSMMTVVLYSIASVKEKIGNQLIFLEWIFISFFTLEYMVRILVAKKKRDYIFSFFGLIDFFSIAPIYISLLFDHMESPLILRSLRLLMVFRMFKLFRFVREERLIVQAFKASQYKIGLFILSTLMFSCITGVIMHFIEHENDGFSNIPQSIYWAITTLTTVGYGDIIPHTLVGKIISSMIMVLGYGVITIPTGLVAAEMVLIKIENAEEKKCPQCFHEKHNQKAKFCSQCGTLLSNKKNPSKSK